MTIQIFLTLDGIKGPTLESGHEGAIDVLSWSWGTANATDPAAAATAGTAPVSFGQLSLTKEIDVTSPRLFDASCNGWQFPSATIAVSATDDAGQRFDQVVITLGTVIVASWQVSQASGDRGAESVSLAFAKATVAFTPSAGVEPVRATFDLAQRTPDV